MPFAFGILGIPLEASSSNINHKFESMEGRGMKITAGLNSVLIKKDLNECSELEEIDVVIKHRYFDYLDQERLK